MRPESDGSSLELAIDTTLIQSACCLVFYLSDVNTACFAPGESAPRRRRGGTDRRLGYSTLRFDESNSAPPRAYVGPHLLRYVNAYLHCRLDLPYRMLMYSTVHTACVFHQTR